MARELEILLVEDEVLTAMFMETALRKAGRRVARKVVSGEEAVAVTEELDIDVVLMDIRLAGQIDGIEAAARIQSIGKAHIIFMTGYDDVETRSRAKALGPLAYLEKPVAIADLLGILNRIEVE